MTVPKKKVAPTATSSLECNTYICHKAIQRFILRVFQFAASSDHLLLQGNSGELFCMAPSLMTAITVVAASSQCLLSFMMMKQSNPTLCKQASQESELPSLLPLTHTRMRMLRPCLPSQLCSNYISLAW